VSRARALVLLACFAAVAAFIALRLEVGTDITHFMPDRHPSELAKISTRLADSPFSRTMVLSIEAGDTQETVRIAQELAGALREHPEVAWLRAGVEEGQLRELYELYFPRRLAFLSDDPETELPAYFSHDQLRERARQLKRRLASPGATLFEQSAVADPIGSFERVIERFQRGEPQLASRGGQFVTLDERFAIVLLGLRNSAFASGPQAGLLRDIDVAFERVLAGADATLEMSGANRFAVAIEQRMKGDIALIASVSFLGVASLFFLFVGSVRGFLVVSVPPLAGILVATAAALVLFGRIDGLTMAFGASLMGIAIDYSNHLLIHHGLMPAGTAPRATLLHLRPSLVLGAATTVASLGGMAATAFPAFREMSFFAAVGVCVALLVTLYVLPDLLHGMPALPRRARGVSARFVALYAGLERAPRPLLWVPLRIDWQDDISQLAELDPAMQAEDNRVRQRVGAPESGHFVIGLAADEREAVALNDAIAADLEPLVASGQLEGVRSLHSLLWSEELQQRNLDWLARQPDLAARVESAFVAEGFRPGSFRPFEDALTGAGPAPLTLADVRASPLGELVRPYSFPLDERVAVVSYLQGLKQPAALRGAVAHRADVHVLDQRTFITDIYGEFRATTLQQLGVGALLVFALLILRYREWRASLAAFLPSAVVALLVLGGFALAGVRTNLMHVMSLVMVMGMGVDYGVFLVDSARERGDVGATMLSLLMSCLTTSFVFGTLALSDQPALRAIGLTTGVGILLSYLLAPITLAAVGVRARGAAR
jgi:predicted exporter